jgi:hypothetical protein
MSLEGGAAAVLFASIFFAPIDFGSSVDQASIKEYTSIKEYRFPVLPGLPSPLEFAKSPWFGQSGRGEEERDVWTDAIS